MTATQHSTSVCPLCGHPNQCASAAFTSESSQTSACWCFDIKLSEPEREKAREMTDNYACICVSCLKSKVIGKAKSHQLNEPKD